MSLKMNRSEKKILIEPFFFFFFTFLNPLAKHALYSIAHSVVLLTTHMAFASFPFQDLHKTLISLCMFSVTEK